MNMEVSCIETNPQRVISRLSSQLLSPLGFGFRTPLQYFSSVSLLLVCSLIKPQEQLGLNVKDKFQLICLFPIIVIIVVALWAGLTIMVRVENLLESWETGCLKRWFWFPSGASCLIWLGLFITCSEPRVPSASGGNKLDLLLTIRAPSRTTVLTSGLLVAQERNVSFRV